MPKQVHDLAKKLEKKKGVKNPFALANSIVEKRGGNAYEGGSAKTAAAEFRANEKRKPKRAR